MVVESELPDHEVYRIQVAGTSWKRQVIFYEDGTYKLPERWPVKKQAKVIAKIEEQLRRGYRFLPTPKR